MCSSDLTLDGQPLPVKKDGKIQLVIPAGPHTLGAALADARHCEGVNDFYDFYSMGGAISGLEINGPFEAGSPGDTPSRRAIFSCKPAKAEEERSCAQTIMSQLATRAYRHPVAANSGEVATLLQFYDKIGRAHV